MSDRAHGRVRRFGSAVAFFAKHALLGVPRALVLFRGAADQQASWSPILVLVWLALAACWPGLFADFGPSGLGADGASAHPVVDSVKAFWRDYGGRFLAVAFLGAYVTAFFSGVWSEIQRGRDRIEELEDLTKRRTLIVEAAPLAAKVEREYSAHGEPLPARGYSFHIYRLSLLTNEQSETVSVWLVFAAELAGVRELQLATYKQRSDVRSFVGSRSTMPLLFPAMKIERLSASASSDATFHLEASIQAKGANEAALDCALNGATLVIRDCRNDSRTASIPMPSGGKAEM